MKLIAVALCLALPATLQESRNAEELFKDALTKAKESKKKVFLTFGSPG